QNPIELEGTFPLPEAQLDRFFLRTALGYPGSEEELEIVRDQRHGHPLGDIGAVARIEEVTDFQHASEEVYVDELLQRWIIELVRATRGLDIVSIGASVRGSLALERAARGWALLSGRDYVVPEDVELLFLPVLGHRILFTPSFLVEVRKIGRVQALQDFKARCLEAAPRPEAALGDGEGVRTGEGTDGAHRDAAPNLLHGPRRAWETARSFASVSGPTELTFPLTPRRRLIGLAFGSVNSAKRGQGSNVASSRPYQPGDTFESIDWAASAKISTAHGHDAVIGRATHAEEAPRVVVVCDRRPAMELYPPGFPWLSKPKVMLEAGSMIADSAAK